MGIEQKTYSFHFDEELVKRLQLHTKDKNRTISNMIEAILLQYLSKHDNDEKNNRLPTGPTVTAC